MLTVVVIRQLDSNCHPTASFVKSIDPKEYASYGEDKREVMLSYLTKCAKQHIEEFKQKFVEFKNAAWFISFVDN